ncbi:unnamed protein product [Lota lota]
MTPCCPHSALPRLLTPVSQRLAKRGVPPGLPLTPYHLPGPNVNASSSLWTMRAQRRGKEMSQGSLTGQDRPLEPGLPTPRDGPYLVPFRPPHLGGEKRGRFSPGYPSHHGASPGLKGRRLRGHPRTALPRILHTCFANPLTHCEELEGPKVRKGAEKAILLVL